MPKQTKEFLALQKHWDKKLADSGFEDAENRDGKLKEWSKSTYARRTIADVSMESKQEYYRAAGQFLYSHRFSAFERKVWELHSEGISMRHIVKTLKDKHSIETYKRQVHETIQKLVKIMMKKIEKENADVRAGNL